MKNFAVNGDEAALSVTSALSSGALCAGAARARGTVQVSAWRRVRLASCFHASMPRCAAP